MKLDKNKGKNYGFTHLELLIVLVIIAVIGVIGYFVFSNQSVVHAGSWTDLTPELSLMPTLHSTSGMSAEACQSVTGSSYTVNIEATDTNLTYNELIFATFQKSGSSYSVVSSNHKEFSSNIHSADGTLVVSSNQYLDVAVANNANSNPVVYFYNTGQKTSVSKVSGQPTNSLIAPAELSNCPSQPSSSGGGTTSSGASAPSPASVTTTDQNFSQSGSFSGQSATISDTAASSTSLPSATSSTAAAPANTPLQQTKTKAQKTSLTKANLPVQAKTGLVQKLLHIIKLII